MSAIIATLLAEGQARVAQTLRKGHAPPHFGYNIELILVEDARSPTSASMRAKVESTRERSAHLRALDPHTLLWWAMAFPMREWSGGRKMSSTMFQALVRYAPGYAFRVTSLLSALSEDLELLRLKHANCSILQTFLDDLYAARELVLDDPLVDLQALSDPSRYVSLSGARHDFHLKLAELLVRGLNSSRRFQEEQNRSASISTAVQVFVPTDPSYDDAYLLFPVGAHDIWHILQELGIESLTNPRYEDSYFSSRVASLEQ